MSSPLIAIPTCRPYGTWMVSWMIRATNIPSLRDVFAFRVFFNDTFRACFERNVPRFSRPTFRPEGTWMSSPLIAIPTCRPCRTFLRFAYFLNDTFRAFFDRNVPRFP